MCGAGLQPGHAAALSPVTVTNPGSAAESITLAVTPVPPGARLAGRGYPVPPSWVHVGYPRLMWVVGQHSVRLGPGASASLPVTVDVPERARRGAYVAGLAAVAGTSQAPGAALGAAAGTYLIFTVGERVPHWPPSLLGLGCWTAPGQPDELAGVVWYDDARAAARVALDGRGGLGVHPAARLVLVLGRPHAPARGLPGRPGPAVRRRGGLPGRHPARRRPVDRRPVPGHVDRRRAAPRGCAPAQTAPSAREPAVTVAAARGAAPAAQDRSSTVSVALAVAVLLAAGLLGAWLTRRPGR